MNVIFTLLAAAEEPAAGGVGIQVLDYLKYGTLGLAGIILLLAFFLAQQANGLPEQARMVVAQKGVTAYMNVAKWLLIPCMGLQILSLFVGRGGGGKEPAQKSVNAYVRVKPLSTETEVRYGAAGVTVGRGANVKKVPGLDDEQLIEIREADNIVVNLEDIIQRMRSAMESTKPDISALRPTSLQ